MDLINQHNAWIASMVGAAVGLLSLMVATISNREKLVDFFRKYWGVVAFVFALAGLWTFYILGGFAYLNNLAQRLLKWMDFQLPIWAVFLILILGVLIWWTFKFFAKSSVKIEVNTDGKIVQSLPSDYEFTPDHYTEDLIFGVWWQWTYHGNTINVPTPICPHRHCQCRLSFEDDVQRWQGYKMPVFLKCPSCGFSQPFDMTEGEVLTRVGVEIERLIRTQQYKGRLKNRLALNQQNG